MKYLLYKDGAGFAVYDPNVGQIRHTLNYLEATEAATEDWADVLGYNLNIYHLILCAGDIARIIR